MRAESNEASLGLAGMAALWTHDIPLIPFIVAPLHLT